MMDGLMAKLTDLFDSLYYRLLPYNGSVCAIQIITVRRLCIGSFKAKERQTDIVQELYVEQDGTVQFEEYASTGYTYRKWQTVIPDYKISKLFDSLEDTFSGKDQCDSDVSVFWELHIEYENRKERIYSGRLSKEPRQRLIQISKAVRSCIPFDGLALFDGNAERDAEEEGYE